MRLFEALLTVTAGGLWFAVLGASFAATSWTARWLGLKGYPAYLFWLVLGIVLPVLIGLSVTALVRRVRNAILQRTGSRGGVTRLQ